jgi:pseudaminic acid biosynthesis-associated methylase
VTTSETPQEVLWRGGFGDEYTVRNASAAMVRSNMSLFSQVLRRTPQVGSIVELGCNSGQNLKALHLLNPSIRLTAYEINRRAAQEAQALGIAKIHCESLLRLDLGSVAPSDLAFTKGVLIHIQPDMLARAYEALYSLSSRYILVCEYYNPSPVTVPYRGTTEALFKRDFAGEMIDRFDVHLIDYGFVYHRDQFFPLDDCTWFLLEKNER